MHVCGASALKCSHCADFPTDLVPGSSWIPAVTWICYVDQQKAALYGSDFCWASNIIHFTASFMTMDLFATAHLLHDFCLFLLKYCIIGWIWSHVCVCCSSEQPDLSQWLNITSLQMKALLSAHRKAKAADADSVDMDGVNDSPPPDGFKLDYTPK